MEFEEDVVLLVQFTRNWRILDMMQFWNHV
jgi:hypothetical protein